MSIYSECLEVSPLVLGLRGELAVHSSRFGLSDFYNKIARAPIFEIISRFLIPRISTTSLSPRVVTWGAYALHSTPA